MIRLRMSRLAQRRLYQEPAFKFREGPCPFCGVPVERHMPSQFRGCFRAAAVQFDLLQIGRQSERIRSFIEVEMLIELARDLLIRREHRNVVIAIIEVLFAGCGLITESAHALAESTVEIAQLRREHFEVDEEAPQ